MILRRSVNRYMESNRKKPKPTDVSSGFSFCPSCSIPITPRNTIQFIDGKIACRKCAKPGTRTKIQCVNCGKITDRFLGKEVNHELFCYRCHTKLFGRWNSERMKLKRLIRMDFKE